MEVVDGRWLSLITYYNMYENSTINCMNHLLFSLIIQDLQIVEKMPLLLLIQRVLIELSFPSTLINIPIFNSIFLFSTCIYVKEKQQQNKTQRKKCVELQFKIQVEWIEFILNGSISRYGLIEWFIWNE